MLQLDVMCRVDITVNYRPACITCCVCLQIISLRNIYSPREHFVRVWEGARSLPSTEFIQVL